MSSSIWAITAYFNPMHWRQRAENFRTFRRHLSIPLVAVELGYDGQFDLQPGDADILIQFPARDVLWQKERLLNVALSAVPADVSLIANLDCDIVFERADWPEGMRAALEGTSLIQLFSHVHHLPYGHTLDFNVIRSAVPAAPGFAWERMGGASTLALCNPLWNTTGPPPVTYGIGWGFRRELFSRRGLYDAWVIGGGTRLHAFAGDGLWDEAADAMKFHPGQRAHFRRWAESFHSEVRGCWGFLPGAVAHLWHGSSHNRRYRQRYEDFSRYAFDPNVDVAIDEYGVWRWASDKPEMHAYVRSYFLGRREDEIEPPVT